MYTHTKMDHRFSNSPAPHLAYFVCSTPRCGSSLLCESLCLTGVAGVPTEYFDAETKAQFCSAWKIGNESEYLKRLLSFKTSPNGVFGVKAHYHQYQQQFGVDKLPSFCNELRFIWLTRNDLIGQAISYWRAIQTNQWASSHAFTNDQPEYDFGEISKLIDQIEYEQSEWERFFAGHEIKPLRLYYEKVCEDIESSTASCLEYLGVDSKHVPKDLVSQLTLTKQADHISAQWRQRFDQEVKQR